MESININQVQRFVDAEVEIRILDQQEGDQAPVVKKTIERVQLCPDGTHIRFYFDHLHFLAVPLACQVCEDDGIWSAFDQESSLTYTIKKVQAL